MWRAIEVSVRRMGVWTIGRVDVQGSGWGIELESMIVLCCIVPQECGIYNKRTLRTLV